MSETFNISENDIFQVISLKTDFTSKLVHELEFGTPKCFIVPYGKTKHELVKLSYNCDVKSGLRGRSFKYKTFVSLLASVYPLPRGNLLQLVPFWSCLLLLKKNKINFRHHDK